MGAASPSTDTCIEYTCILVLLRSTADASSYTSPSVCGSMTNSAILSADCFFTETDTSSFVYTVTRSSYTVGVEMPVVTAAGRSPFVVSASLTGRVVVLLAGTVAVESAVVTFTAVVVLVLDVVVIPLGAIYVGSVCIHWAI